MKKLKPDRRFPTLDDLEVEHKRVLVRMDLNVPMLAGRITDNTRIVRLLPTLKILLKRHAKIIILAHMGRPKGKYIPDLTLSPLVDALAAVLQNVPVKFGVDCVGDEAKAAIRDLKDGEILLLENVRFHAGEESNDPEFGKALAELADVYVNDAFSASHRAHASVVGVTRHLPFAAGKLMEEELMNLERFNTPQRPLTAIVGGSKISTKLELLENLIRKVDTLVIGGAMANTFLHAQGYSVGKSLIENDLLDTARRVLDTAKKNGCHILLPRDVMIGKSPSSPRPTTTVAIDAIPADSMVLDVGNQTVRDISDALGQSKTVFWNGPLGVFETRPFDVATLMLAREIAQLTGSGKLQSIAGGGDTVAALSVSGLTDSMSYVSTAGGAFLEWMEGKNLPGVAALQVAA